MNPFRLITISTMLVFAGCSSAPEKQAPVSPAAFLEAAAEVGLQFPHDPHLQGKYYLTEIMGSGAALFDFDNDGDLDAYLVQGHPASGASRLFENRLVPDGKLAFVDITDRAGLAVSAVGMGVSVADYDNDGFLDLYQTNFGRNHLLHNNAGRSFTDVTAKAGVDDDRWSTSSAWFDYDRDGDLDLYVASYVDFSEKNNKDCFTSSGEADYCTPSAYAPLTHRLFRNDGGGKFTDVSAPAGVLSAPGPGLGVATGDFDMDGWLDLFVANDGKANLLWMNLRNGRFEERGLVSGAAFSEDGVAKAGMGISTGDFDNDGDEDVVVANLTNEGATLFRNDGRGVFGDSSNSTGIRQASYGFTGFGLRWYDLDHDGWLDLFVTNGAVTKLEKYRGRPYPFQQRKLLLRNTEGGSRFVDIAAAAGGALSAEEVSRGAAFGDVDNDGDIDVLVNNNHGPARLYLNQSSGASVQVSLRAAGGNGRAYGARVALTAAGKPVYWRRAGTDGSYCAASDDRVHLAWPASVQPDGLLVRWPDGSEQRFPFPAGQKFVTLTESRPGP